MLGISAFKRPELDTNERHSCDYETCYRTFIHALIPLAVNVATQALLILCVWESIPPGPSPGLLDCTGQTVLRSICVAIFCGSIHEDIEETWNMFRWQREIRTTPCFV